MRNQLLRQQFSWKRQWFSCCNDGTMSQPMLRLSRLRCGELVNGSKVLLSEVRSWREKCEWRRYRRISNLGRRLNIDKQLHDSHFQLLKKLFFNLHYFISDAKLDFKYMSQQHSLHRSRYRGHVQCFLWIRVSWQQPHRSNLNEQLRSLYVSLCKHLQMRCWNLEFCLVDFRDLLHQVRTWSTCRQCQCVGSDHGELHDFFHHYNKFS